MYRTNDNTATGNRLIVIDCEFYADFALYQRYCRIDPEPARCRWPMKRVAAVSVMELAVPDERLEVTAFKSWSGPDEGRVVDRLFTFLAERPFHRLVTYGGVACDVAVLRLAAMQHHLRLPPQLRFGDRARHVHLDLAIAMKGGEGSYVHQLELATRLNIPCKLADCAADVPRLVDRGEFRRIEHIAESDVITTAFLLASYLKVQGEISSARAAQRAIIGYVRPLRAHADYTRVLGNIALRLKREMDDEIPVLMRRAA